MGEAPPPPHHAGPSAGTGGSAPNHDLNGHKVVLLSPFKEDPAYRERLVKRFPGLIVQHVDWNVWAKPQIPSAAELEETGQDAIDWSTVTVFVTGPNFPEVGQAPKLELVQLQSAGANYVLGKPIFKDTEIAFCTANGVHGPQISEWVIATFLAHQHQIPYYLDRQKEAKWVRDPETIQHIDDTVGQRVGILGYGAIGRQVARVATAMGMSVHAYTNRPRDTPASRKDHAYCPPGLGDPDGTLPARWFSGDLAAFLDSDLDLLVIAVPLTPATTGLIGREQLQLLKKRRTYVSNIGRGPVLSTDALIEALDEGWIRGAALDVTDPEPLTDGHALWGRKNVIITPHVSGHSKSYGARLGEILFANLERLSEGKGEFLNRVDKGRGY
ncbi:hypothetical protein Micbo1qcDRAFT_166140 [Microdochium bolleyi]|uniref:D-isomer specific 2-hydroxyacid dehydrogenase NAD-binding domain-containing protein n=1 Tax=Microdochium bolleyi TaxID=196109 RepID=A0A136IUV4_9PEZI|nr:hypothetical protein Micbo1qcDRAFT_166140 [Microdochium bolleyi]